MEQPHTEQPIPEQPVGQPTQSLSGFPVVYFPYPYEKTLKRDLSQKELAAFLWVEFRKKIDKVEKYKNMNSHTSTCPPAFKISPEFMQESYQSLLKEFHQVLIKIENSSKYVTICEIDKFFKYNRLPFKYNPNDFPRFVASVAVIKRVEEIKNSMLTQHQ